MGGQQLQDGSTEARSEKETDLFFLLSIEIIPAALHCINKQGKAGEGGRL